jgi:hypothetical protein
MWFRPVVYKAAENCGRCGRTGYYGAGSPKGSARFLFHAPGEARGRGGMSKIFLKKYLHIGKTGYNINI